MISESTPNSALYEWDKIPIESIIGLPVLDEIPEEDKILISNKILKDFTGSIVLH